MSDKRAEIPTASTPGDTNPNPNTNTNTTNPKKKRSRRQRGNRNYGKNGRGNESGSRGNSGHSNKPMSAEKISRALSWALRHAALDIGLSIRKDGFVPVQEILDSTHPKLRGATLENIKLVVDNSDKQRFKLEERPRRMYESKNKEQDPAYPSTTQGEETKAETILCIRANQGHSIALINPELLLKKLSPDDVRSLPCIVHGTYPNAWESIQRAASDGGGLKKMNRTHIHFASGLPADDGVISGMRKSCSVYIYIDASRCAADDRIEFFCSDNGVILTDGVGNTGVLPIDYFSHVTDSSGKILLDNRTNHTR